MLPLAEARRRQSNKQRVLEALLDGPKTNAELIHVGGFRYAARVWELTKAYDIRTEQVCHGLYRYTLIGPRTPGQVALPL